MAPLAATIGVERCFQFAVAHALKRGAAEPGGVKALERLPHRRRRKTKTARQEKSSLVLAELEPKLREKLALISQKTKLAEAIRYALSRWGGLTRFLDDGCIEIDSDIVERAIRPIALSRKNALFAGSDDGAENWAIGASLIETCKLNRVDPLTYMTEVLPKIFDGHVTSKLDELIPWAYAPPVEIKDVA